MKLESITNKNVEQLLKDMYAGREVHSELLEIAFLTLYLFKVWPNRE